MCVFKLDRRTEQILTVRERQRLLVRSTRTFWNNLRRDHCKPAWSWIQNVWNLCHVLQKNVTFYNVLCYVLQKGMKLMLCPTVSYVMFYKRYEWNLCYVPQFLMLYSTKGMECFKNVNEVDCFYLFTTKTASRTLTHNLTSVHLQKQKAMMYRIQHTHM